MSDVELAVIPDAFQVWAELVGGLRDRYVAELEELRPYSPHAGQVLGMLAEMVRRCEHLTYSLERLRAHDAKSYEAFVRALENS